MCLHLPSCRILSQNHASAPDTALDRKYLYVCRGLSKLRETYSFFSGRVVLSKNNKDDFINSQAPPYIYMGCRCYQTVPSISSLACKPSTKAALSKKPPAATKSKCGYRTPVMRTLIVLGFLIEPSGNKTCLRTFIFKAQTRIWVFFPV